VLERAAQLGPEDAWPQYLLGLSLERAGERGAAEARFAAAAELAPDDFPARQQLSAAEFDEAVREAVALLPEDIRRHVAETLVSVKELPDDNDLREHVHDHGLSPQMLGMFRGPSLRERVAGELPPAIFLFQRNLERAARTREELVEQIRVTVLHEVGHLLGLSEEDLHERGLE
jgi:predicted Zn-dependent protease with MMP-like domain